MKTKNLFKVLAVLSPMVFAATFSLNSLAITPEDALKPDYCLSQEAGLPDYYSLSGAQQEIRDDKFEACQNYVLGITLSNERSELEGEAREQRREGLKKENEKQKAQFIVDSKTNFENTMANDPFKVTPFIAPKISPMLVFLPTETEGETSIDRAPGLNSSDIELVDSGENLIQLTETDSNDEAQLSTKEIAINIVPKKQNRIVANLVEGSNIIVTPAVKPKAIQQTRIEQTLPDSNFDNLVSNEGMRVQNLSADAGKQVEIPEQVLVDSEGDQAQDGEQPEQALVDSEGDQAQDGEQPDQFLVDLEDNQDLDDTLAEVPGNQELTAEEIKAAEELLTNSEAINQAVIAGGDLDDGEIEALGQQIASNSDILKDLEGDLTTKVESTEKTEAELTLDKTKAELEEAKLALAQKDEELKAQKEELTAKASVYEKAYCEQKNEFASLSQEFKDLKQSIADVNKTVETPELVGLLQQLIATLSNRPQQQQVMPQFSVQSGLDSGFERGFYAFMNATGQKTASAKDIVQGKNFTAQPIVNNYYSQDSAKALEQQRLRTTFAYDFNSSPVINSARYTMNAQNSPTHNNRVFENIERMKNGENVFTGEQINVGVQRNLIPSTQARQPTSNIVPAATLGVK